MKSRFLTVKRFGLEALLLGALGALCVQFTVLARRDVPFTADYSVRNADFPNTYISEIHVDLSSPGHWVRLNWLGSQAQAQEPGPFHSSPGRGLGDNDCNDIAECNRMGSFCTPKGEWIVEGHSDYLPSAPRCTYATWFQMPREIAFHSHKNVPDYPASHGCVRLDVHAAQLIHNNSVVGKTKVIVDGVWTPPPTSPTGASPADTEPTVDSQMTRDEALEGLDPNCPQSIRDRQELVDVEYYSFDGNLHRGQVVIDRDLAGDIRYVFSVAREHRFPIESVIPVSHPRFRRDGLWNDRLSMQANNTSGFNYRETTSGQMLSDHATGRAVDINPLQNPYINGETIHPKGAYYDPSAPGTLNADSQVVQAFLGPCKTFCVTPPGHVIC